MPGTVRFIDPVQEVVTPARFGSDHPMRTVTEQIAEGNWSPEMAGFVTGAFDELSSGWHADHTSAVRLAAVRDVLDRGGIGPGRLVELGCGTGAGTELVAALRPVSAAVDISARMLAHADRELAPFVRADAQFLPFPPASVDVLLLVNMFLFATEVDRVLAPDGLLVWISTMRDETPIYLPPDTVLNLLPGEWTATGSHAGTGLWMVARRAGPST